MCELVVKKLPLGGAGLHKCRQFRLFSIKKKKEIDLYTQEVSLT